MFLIFSYAALIGQQIKLGNKLKVDVHSKTENIDRTIFIQLPKDYGKVNKSYPLIILFDAQDQSLYNYVSSTIDRLTWTNDIPEAIFIGVTQKDRSKELGFEKNETSAMQFLGFVKNDLINYLSKHYSLNGYYTLIGHSLGGQFVTNAMITYPETFRSVINVSGALNYPEHVNGLSSKTIAKLDQFLASSPDSVFSDQKYYFSTGDEGFQDGGFKSGALTANTLFMRYKPNAKNWHFDYLKGFNHMTSPLISIPSGLTFIFHDWHFSDSMAMDVLFFHKTDPLEALKIQNQHIYKSYKTKISIPGNAFYQFAEYYLSKGEIDSAKILTAQIIDMYPNDDEAYSLMAQVLIKQGDVKNAVRYLEKAQSKSSIEKYAGQIRKLKDK
jgi:hypothetical protein